MERAAIHFKGVSKRFGKLRVLDNVDLQLRDGEFLGLVGVNGAGKTTLIKCLVDLCDPSGGSIDIFGLPTPNLRHDPGLLFFRSDSSHRISPQETNFFAS